VREAGAGVSLLVRRSLTPGCPIDIATRVAGRREWRMKKVSISEAVQYFPPAHNDCACFRLQGKDATGITQFSLGCTHFLPGGGADFSPDRPFDTIYFVIEGEVTIIDKDNNEITLKKYDSIYIPPNEGRAIKNKTQFPASMMVILGVA
jgi:glyoxylate utilization-related uncharacterized protein